MSRAATWTNSDGLVVGFGTHSADNDVAGQDSGRGRIKTMTVHLSGADITTQTATDATIPPQAAQIKRGSRIHSARLTCIAPWTSTGTLNIGTWGRGTLATPAVDDLDGIDATIDVSSALAAAGDTVICDGALVNATVTVGETSNSDCVISFGWATSTMTDGEAELVIEYTEPVYDDPLEV
jgi:hypothetical protein